MYDMGSHLSRLPSAKPFRRRRFSSYDRSGGNKDMRTIEPGETAAIAETDAAGCIRHINIHNRRVSANWDWPGEGDDMIFVDGEAWPPELHGTGTEDYVNMAFCPTAEYNAPYHGLILGGGINWAGKITYYRYHILDPIPFRSSIRSPLNTGTPIGGQTIGRARPTGTRTGSARYRGCRRWRTDCHSETFSRPEGSWRR